MAEKAGTVAVVGAISCTICCSCALISPFIVALMKARNADFDDETCTDIASWLEELMWIVVGNFIVNLPLQIVMQCVDEDCKKIMQGVIGFISTAIIIVVAVWYVISPANHKLFTSIYQSHLMLFTIHMYVQGR